MTTKMFIAQAIAWVVSIALCLGFGAIMFGIFWSDPLIIAAGDLAVLAGAFAMVAITARRVPKEDADVEACGQQLPKEPGT